MDTAVFMWFDIVPVRFIHQRPHLLTDAPAHVFKDGLMEHIGDVNEPMTH